MRKNTSSLKTSLSCHIEITKQDLPLACPMPNMSKWSLHPKVYLPIEDNENKEAYCPYCGTHYILLDKE